MIFAPNRERAGAIARHNIAFSLNKYNCASQWPSLYNEILIDGFCPEHGKTLALSVTLKGHIQRVEIICICGICGRNEDNQLLWESIVKPKKIKCQNH